MANVNWRDDMAEWVYNETGKWSALTSYDFIQYTHANDKYKGDYTWVDYDALVENAIKWWNNGGLVSILWHWHDPSRETTAFWSNNTNLKPSTGFDPSAIFDKESEDYKAMISDIDIVASHMLKLQEAGVPIIWRPLPEAAGTYENGPWFWWGNAKKRDRAETCVELYKVMYDRLVNHHKLNNIIWLWVVSLDKMDYLWFDDCKKWYPGHEYVDIIGLDIYDDAIGHGSHLDLYKKSALVGDLRKIITISECGHIPDPDILIQNNEMWSWFMPWYGEFTTSEKYNKNFWSQALNHDLVLTRDELPSFK